MQPVLLPAKDSPPNWMPVSFNEEKVVAVVAVVAKVPSIVGDSK